MLPSGYIICDGVEGSYDSGVVSASDLEINGLFKNFSNVLSETLWYFGSRNTNSNTSAGQLNFDIGGSGTTYFGCGSARTSLSNYSFDDYFHHIYVLNNYFEFCTNKRVWSTTGSATAFTGTRNMYINGMNNAGTLQSGHPDMVFGFIIKKNGVLLKNFIPCYDETNSEFGLYDTVNEEFISPLSVTPGITQRRARVTSSGHGKGYFRTVRNEKVEDMFVSQIYDTDFIQTPKRCRIECTAEADAGYVFKNWTINGSVVSVDANYTFFALSDVDIVANFQKETYNMGLDYRLLVLGTDKYDLNVRSASVSDDILQRSTTTITVKEVPSSIKVGDRAILRSPKGEELYFGIINSIEENIITCREMLSLFDRNYIFKNPIFSVTNYTVRHGLTSLMTRAIANRNFYLTNSIDPLLYNWLNFIYEDSNNTKDDLSLYEDNNSLVTFPVVLDDSVQNLEDFIMNFSSFGIYTSYEHVIGSGSMQFVPRYYKNNESVKLGDNLENISNIQITIESQENTVCLVYDSTGGTVRGMYGVALDGSIKAYSTGSDLTQFMGYTNYIGNVVLSDDDIKTILAENLSCSGLNHKITFNVDFNSLVPFHLLKVGTPVEFYSGGQLYKSVVTGLNFDIMENTEKIMNAKVTLGNVRTSLTSKLNLRK